MFAVDGQTSEEKTPELSFNIGTCSAPTITSFIRDEDVESDILYIPLNDFIVNTAEPAGRQSPDLSDYFPSAPFRFLHVYNPRLFITAEPGLLQFPACPLCVSRAATRFWGLVFYNLC